MDVPLPERTLWPVRAWPMPDELLSSWLNRVAIANGLAPRSFYLSLARAIGWKSIATGYVKYGRAGRFKGKETSILDLRCDRQAAQFLAQRSGIPERTIQSLALRRPKDLPVGTPSRAGTLQWEVIEAFPERIRPDDDRRGYMGFCPYCLLEWDNPWFRKFWRTTFCAVCTRHACRLLFNCGCGKSVRPHLSQKPHSQAFCYSCNHDLRRLDAQPAYPREIKAQRERYRRVYDEAEKLVRRGSEHSDIFQMLEQPKYGDVIYLGKRQPSLQLVKTGLIDAYGVNSAMSLYLLYREIHRDARDKNISPTTLSAKHSEIKSSRLSRESRR